jgi:fructokinase
MSRNIYGVGEVVYDIIFKNDIPFDARPGGAILNSMVSLSRMGLNTSMIADCVEDKVGKIILDFIIENKINTDYIHWYNSGRSRLALAFLKENNDADYLFYKMQSDDHLSLAYPITNENDIVLFGSYYGIKPEIRKGLRQFLETASKNNSVIVYDPNFRIAHLPMLEQVRESIYENFKFADIVKGSEEDFFHIFNSSNYDEIYLKFKEKGGNNLIITCAGKDVHFYNNNCHIIVPVPNVNTVSTIGAGDTFSAAIVYKLNQFNFLKKDIATISEEDWKEMLSFAVNCAVTVCQSIENYIPVGFLECQSSRTSD